MKRILHINNNTDLGGQQRVFMDILQNTDINKYNIDLVVYNDNGFYSEMIRNYNCNIYVVPSITKHFFKHIIQLSKIIKNGNYDIVHQHASNSGIFINLIIAKIFHVKKIIVHSHCESNISKNKIIGLFNNVFRYFINKLSDVRIACSKSAGEWLFTKDFTVIDNCVDLEKFKFNNRTRLKFRKKYKISDDTIVLGTVGRLAYVKNQEFIINLFSEYQKINNNSKLMIVGDGPLKEKLETLAKKLKILKNVIFVGSVSNVEDYYNIFDVFLFSSFNEGLGICVLEALSNGLTCISNEKLPVIEDTIRVKLDINEWLKALNTLNFERNNYNLNRYNIDSFINKIDNIYKG